MKSGLKIGLPLVSFFLLFHGLSLSEPVPEGLLSENFPKRTLPAPNFLFKKISFSFSPSTFAAEQNTLIGDGSVKTLLKNELPGKAEAPSARNPEEVESPQNDFPLFEKGRIWKDKSSYYLGNFYLRGTRPLLPFSFMPCLSLARYQEENFLFWALEGYKEGDLFKSLAILFELKLKY